MDILQTILVIVHMVVAVAIIAAPLIGNGRGSSLQAWSARVQLLVGLVLVGLLEAGDGAVNHMKIGIKLLVMLGVIACAEIAFAKEKKGEANKLAYVAAALALVNVVVAYAL